MGIAVPRAPKIYHITHLDNLPSMVSQGGIWSDAETQRRSLICTTVGMSKIKRRRLEEHAVSCHPGTKVGEYVPFYFCPRSIMLYLLSQRNHPNLHYQGGQRPIVHLEADLLEAVKWAEANEQHWAFSTCNAAAHYCLFYNQLSQLDKIDWTAVSSTDWREPHVKESKQAEYLHYAFFPWHLFRRMGVMDMNQHKEAHACLANAKQRPLIMTKPDWYY